MTFDAIVVGLGGMGSAALYHLARRGARVLGVEQYALGHERGSSHGQTRIIRKAYFEHSDYVPLLHHAYDLWDELALETGRELFVRCGLLLAGPDDGAIIGGVRKAASTHRLPIQELTPAAARRRFPAFRFDGDLTALFERDAGFLWVERCVEAHWDAARRHGAQVRTDTEVLGWAADGAGVTVQTTTETVRAERLVLTAGAWTGRLLRDLRLPLTIRRKPVFWYPAVDALYAVEGGMPVFGFHVGGRFLYGFPAIDGALKAADHTGGSAVVDPGSVDRSVTPEDEVEVAAFLRHYLPGVGAARVRESVCFYTMTPDEHFVIDRHPHRGQVVFAGGFSGHGFKFASIVGSVLADLALEGRTRAPIDFLRLERPGLR